MRWGSNDAFNRKEKGSGEEDELGLCSFFLLSSLEREISGGRTARNKENQSLEKWGVSILIAIDVEIPARWLREGEGGVSGGKSP